VLHPLSHRDEDGSLPLALLASIIVAGLIGAMVVRVTASERQVRFDRAFTEALHVADVGVNRGLFALNHGGALPDQSSPDSETVDGTTYEWHGAPAGPRTWEVTSTATAPSGEQRRVVARIEEEPLFFPGAFADKLVGLNGASSKVDSYNSDPSCPGPVEDCGWGTDKHFGTGNGSIGTNDIFDFSGNVTLRPNSAFLYDMDGNPPVGATEPNDPFGDRCDVGNNPQNLCTRTYVEGIDVKLDLTANARMAFIRDKFASGAACDTRSLGNWRPSGAVPLASYADSQAPGAVDTSISDPTDPLFENFYCADTLQFVEDIKLDPSVTPENPVVVFVADAVQVVAQHGNRGTNVACYGSDNTTVCDAKDHPGGDDNRRVQLREVLPQAARLQIYVLGESSSGNNVTFGAGSRFAGVVYAPLSRCGGASRGGAGGADIDIYGAAICKFMDNVGGWRFHYDDALGTYGTGLWTVGYWTEEAPTP
jgi:hypothetical protein